MWLTNSSIGRKVIMSVTGIALILFLTFHACMNLVALFSAEGYNLVCEMLGANWYAVAATVGLAVLVGLHFVYAIILTLQNRKARGNSRYAVTDRPAKVEWASQNMLVLGIIVVLGLALHLYNFWYNMMFAELANAGVPFVYGVESASVGYGIMALTFSCPVYTALYIVWFLAIWFYMTHGFWSAFQTLGCNGEIWFARWRAIGMVYVTVLMLIFVVVALKFAFCGAGGAAACGGSG